VFVGSQLGPDPADAIERGDPVVAFVGNPGDQRWSPWPRTCRTVGIGLLLLLGMSSHHARDYVTH
jgi:hypothetical protein